MAHPLFTPEVRLMLADDDGPAMKAFCETLHPATVAEALDEEFTPEEVWRFLSHADIKIHAAIFEYFPPRRQVQLVEAAGGQQMARLIEKMAPDDRAELLRRLRPEVAESLLGLVDAADRRDIAALASYPPNTAGALMTTDYAWVPENITVADTFDRLRLQAPDKETIYYVYVLGEGRRLLGVVTLRKLVLSPRSALIKDVMETRVEAVRASDDQEQVAQVIARYDLLAIPVVDDDGRLVGIVTYDDAIDIINREATEDVERLGGVSGLVEDYLETPFFTVWRKRVVWLSLLFLAELFTFSALASFQDAIERVMVLVLFVPLCISTGGNSGSQAATLIIRALALGQIQLRQWWRVLRHEILMGLALGLALGAIGFVRAALTPSHILHGQVDWWQLAAVVALALMVICLWGTLIGSMLPLIFRRLGFDPAFASSPFVATFVDVTGIMIYFTIATMWIPGVRG
jgi:magnesium transporter